MRVNGQDYTLTAPMVLSDFLTQEGYKMNRVVCERNGAIITQDQFDKTMLSNDDHLEIVQFVGGG